MKVWVLSLTMGAFACAGVVAVSQVRSVKVGDKVSPALPGKRNPESAMVQAKALMLAYINAGKNWKNVESRLKFHPDQLLVADKFRRNGDAFMPFGLTEFYKGRIAFACDMYVNQNLTYEGGDIVKGDPKGFWIVGFESGEVKQVPVSRVRYFYRKSKAPGGEEWSYIFPGMREYAISDPKSGVRH